MILVFKTNVSAISEIKRLKALFDQHLQNLTWNFDLEDCDKILRIDGKVDVSDIIQLLNAKGFACEELSD